MQTLMVDFIISLDGYGAAEGWPPRAPGVSDHAVRGISRR
jgi:hypothetical protein